MCNSKYFIPEYKINPNKNLKYSYLYINPAELNNKNNYENNDKKCRKQSSAIGK